ncbi:hypothetical protein ABMA46_07295 [Mesorhizobium sp. CN5-321]|uniref:hypothetical protein n=1 Tax=Mesorhizobium hunchu TaxID=3157708 RepID=UPI0032B87419
MSELPHSWAEASIADVTMPFMSVDPTKTPDRAFRYVDIGSIDNKTQTITDPKSFFGSDAPSRARRLIRTGDTLFSTVRTYLKNIALVPEELNGELTSTGIAVLRPSDAVDPGYLFRWACSDNFVGTLSGAQDGTMYPAVSDRDVATAAIPLPPLFEQRRIVAKIDSLAGKSRRARDHLDHIPRLVEKYKQAVLATALNPHEMAGWQHAQLEGVVADALIGLVRGKSEQSATHGVPYIRMNHYDLDGRWNEDDLTLVGADAQEMARYELREGDLLFNTRNSFELVGKVALWSKRPSGYLYNNNLLRLRFKPEVIPAFAFYQMISPQFRTYLHSVKSATTSVCAIYQRSIMAAPWAYPEIDQQLAIAGWIEAAFAKIDRLASEATSARKLIDRLDQAVLAKAFRGELVPQDPDDEPASVLLERIRAERGAVPKTKRGRPAG